MPEDMPPSETSAQSDLKNDPTDQRIFEDHMVFRGGEGRRGGSERLYSGLWFLVKCVSLHFFSFLCFRNDPNEQILLS